MSLLGSGRDDRRRRTLAEGTGDSTPALVAAAPLKTSGKPQRYTAAAHRDHHRRITDFIPRSPWALAIWYLAGLGAITGLLAGLVFMSDFRIAGADGVVPLFDARRGDSLAGWFSSFTLAMAAAGSLLVYTVRRHKVDDYRGRYRLWLWCALAWLTMSIDATANLHTPFSQAMALLVGWAPLGNFALWSVCVWGAILSILGIRLLFETRECRLATTSLVAAILLWAAATAIDFGWLSIPAHSVMVAISCRLVGQATLLLAVGIYARHVLLDAQGLFTPREPKPRREKPAKKKSQAAPTTTGDEGSGKSTRVDSAHKPAEKRTDLQSQPARPGASSLAANRSATDDDDDSDGYESRSSNYNRYDDEDDDEGPARGKLSKAERKRLRKLKRQQERDDD